MIARNLIVPLASIVAVMLLTGCGSSGPAVPAGLSISGPGLQEGVPSSAALQSGHGPWHPEYAHLAARLKLLGLPPGGKETFHHHALLHIYYEGLLVPVEANIGLNPAKGVESSMHTHDRTGVIHMEAPAPYPYTLGDFFSVWGVKLGPGRLGGLKGYGGDKLHFYLNGMPLANPAAYRLRDNDSIVIGYGAPASFPHAPSTFALKEVEGKGGRALACSKGTKDHPATSCLTVKPASK